MHKFLSAVAGVVLALFAGVPLHADDTEIYFAGQDTGLPNVLFLLDGSGSMAADPDGNSLEGGASHPNSRYQIMKRALQSALANIPDNINAGLIHYGGHLQRAVSNGIKYPVVALNDTARTNINQAVEDLHVQGYTPIVQALYESALYFRGGKVDYGASADPPIREAHQDSYGAGGKADETTTTTQEGWCNQTAGDCADKKLTGGACRDVAAWCNKTAGECASITTLTGICQTVPASPAGCEDQLVPDQCVGGFDEAGNCLAWSYRTEQACWDAAPEYEECEYKYNECPYTYEEKTTTSVLNANYRSPINNVCQANYLVLLSDGEPNDGLPDSDPAVVAKAGGVVAGGCADQPGGLEDGRCGPELTNFLATKDQSAALEGDQFVNTYAIGFAVEGRGQQYLKSVANLGAAGKKSGETGFFNAENEDQLVQALTEIVDTISESASTFSPPAISLDSATRLENGSDVFVPMFRPGRLPYWIGNVKKYKLDTSTQPPVLKDSVNANVVSASGQIADSVRSFWLTDTVPDGAKVSEGGVAHLLGTKRNLLTSSSATAANPTLVKLDKSEVKASDFGDGVNAGMEKKLLDFIQGKKASDETQPRKRIGDVLHSRPVLVTYPSHSVVFAGTNEGYLHAFRADTGEELFGFMPRELLKNVKTFYDNKLDTTKERPNGMDGPITLLLNDTNGDGVVTAANGETAYLYVGMRRGGRNYYALDVTNPSNPSLMWVIRGGSGDFTRLGQSWSAAIPATVELGGKKHSAVIFSGGYDPAQDTATTRKADSMGDSVFIVDAKTGEHLWSAAVKGMSNSIPANPRVIDIDGNGVADRVYVGDTGGRIFRIDLPDSTNKQMKNEQKNLPEDDAKNPKPLVTMIADLGGDDSAENNRRFFYEPDASIVRDGTKRLVALAIGSGYRSHPLETGATQDRLYMVADPNVYKIAKSVDAITNASLADVTSKAADGSGSGWYLDLKRTGGEKALARAVTLNNRVFFTTFEPSSGGAKATCGPPKHQGRVYALDIRNAKAVIRFTDLDAEPADLSEADRVLGLLTPDILPEVHVNIRKDPEKNNAVVVDTFIGGKFDRFLGQQRFESLRRVYWEQEK